MAGKVTISCAVTGAIHTPGMSPALPITPKQLWSALATPPEARAMLCRKGSDRVGF